MELHELGVARSCEMARGDRAQLLNVGEVRMQLKQRWHGRAAWHGVTVLMFWILGEVFFFFEKGLGRGWHGRAPWHGVTVLLFWPVEKCMARFGVFVGEMCLGVWKNVGQQA